MTTFSCTLSWRLAMIVVVLHKVNDGNSFSFQVALQSEALFFEL